MTICSSTGLPVSTIPPFERTAENKTNKPSQNTPLSNPLEPTSDSISHGSQANQSQSSSSSSSSIVLVLYTHPVLVVLWGAPRPSVRPFLFLVLL